ncbi:putative transcription factor C2H2 family [Dioscorea sansibarensis]
MEEEKEVGLNEYCSSTSRLCLCRICHEEEDESSTSMETPCSCSGTLKFAHRGCIQRWCEEKGSIVCEICLQKFEPGYTVPPKKALVDVPVTIRGSLEVPRLNYDPSSDEEDEYPACTVAAERSFSYCRTIALMFTLFLLFRHLVAALSITADHYALTVLMVFALRAIGILLPFYLMMRIITVLQQQHFEGADESSTREMEADESRHHVIDIHS